MQLKTQTCIGLTKLKNQESWRSIAKFRPSVMQVVKYVVTNILRYSKLSPIGSIENGQCRRNEMQAGFAINSQLLSFHCAHEN